MTRPIILVEGVGKRYRIGVRERPAESLREALGEALRSPFSYLRQVTRPATEEETLWSLRDVSFEAQQGEVLGIVGQNGAGKSTLLKILSRITEPTTGRARLLGRVGSLLEVGSGFHPELTGRENTYLNGVILGMRRREVSRKLDEIVAFAGIEKFLDTPVKRYSSGMYVRLAFAVAAHLEPEILIIDEVLAVGDIGFQKKCLAKMEEVGRGGRTVLFVSHNMSAVARLCTRAIVLDEGRVRYDGPVTQAVNTYLETNAGVSANREWLNIADAPGDEVVRLRAVQVTDENGEVTGALDIARPFKFSMTYDVLEPNVALTPVFRVANQEGVIVFTVLDTDWEWRRRPRPVGRYTSTVCIPGHFMTEGTFMVFAGISSFSPHYKRVYERDIISFQIIERGDEQAARGDWGGEILGVVRPKLNWETAHRLA